MTEERKKEIREAALQVKGGLEIARKDVSSREQSSFNAIKSLVEAVLELTEPDRAPLGEETKEDQEKLWVTFWDAFYAPGNRLENIKAEFILSRRSPDKSQN